MVKVSAFAVPLNTTTRAVSASLPITLVPMALTVVVAMIPWRVKLALPSAAMLIVIVPLVSPAKLTLPLLSVTVNSATLETLTVKPWL